MDDNTKLIWLAVIAMLSPLLAQIPSLVLAVVNRKNAKAESDARFEATKSEIAAVKEQGAELHAAVDGRLTELVSASAGQAKAEGIIQGTQVEQARTAEPQK